MKIIEIKYKRFKEIKTKFIGTGGVYYDTQFSRHFIRNQILKYEEIEFELWNDKEMTTHALKSFIKELRNKLPVNVIKNVPQEGYTLQK